MKRIAILLVTFFPLVAAAQTPVTGFPPYGSFADGKFDAVNRQNLNVNFAIPVMSSPGRGTDLNFSIDYNSLLYTRVTVGSNTSWQFSTGWNTSVVKGSFSYTSTFQLCQSSLEDTVRDSNWAYTDELGTRHAFNLSFYEQATACHYQTGPRTGYATDGSGYYLDVTDPTSPIVISPAGQKYQDVGVQKILTDTNGNIISTVIGQSGWWQDTLGRTALKITNNGNTSTTYQYLDTSGGYQTITLNLQSFSIKSNFSCTGVTEYTGTAFLPTSLMLPNSQSYSFTYEDTPSTPGYKTGRVKRVTLPTGGYYEYQYPTSPNNGINCADGNVNSLTRVISVDGVSTVSWQYSRDPAALKTTITAPLLPYDAAANQSTFTFDGSGRQISQKIYQGSEGTGTLLRTLNTVWAANGTPASTTVILEDGSTQAKTETDFDTYGNLLELREYAWGTGAPGSLVRKTTNTYTTIGFIRDRLSSQVISDGSTIKSRAAISYDGSSFSGANCITGAAQHDDTSYSCTFTARGNPTSITRYTDPVTPSGGITKTFTYDSLGNLRTADLNCCNQKQWNFSATTQYAYPDSVVRGSSSPQLTTSATYNSYTGQVATSTDENGQVTTYTYNDPGHLNRLTDIQRPDLQHVTYAYDDTARTVTVSSPIQSGATVKQVSYFDGLGRSIKQQVTDNGGASYSIGESQYDALGRPFRASNPHNSSAQYWNETDFDALGRPTAAKVLTSTYTVTPGNTSTYLYAGSAVTVTDPAGKQRKSVVDGLGRLTTVYEPDVANGNNLTQSTTYTYNPLDELLTATQGIQTRSYIYDALGRLLSSTAPESGRTCFGTVSGSTCNTDGYDSFDNLKYRTDARGVLTNYSYDTLNRLSQISYNVGSTGVPATPTVTYTYGIDSSCNAAHGTGCIGRLITMTDGVGSENYTYDILGRTLQLQKTINGTSYPMNYTYNYAGEMTSIQYPSVTRTVQSSYDAIGRLCSVGTSGSTCSTGTNYANGFGYNPAGQVTGFNYANGVSATLAYTADRLLLQTLSYAQGATTLLSLSYGYTQNGGNNGQITSITDNTGTQEAGRSVTYTFDALYRLSTAVTTGSTNYPQWGLSWAYDRYGNRLNQTQTAGSPPTNSLSFASPSGGALTNRQDNMCFDANGNLLAETPAPCPSPTYVYDAENRMVNYSSASYTYDGNGLRVKKVSGSTTTVYIFSGSKVIAEYDNGAPVGSPSREYLYSGGALLAKVEGGATSYYHPDHLSTRVLTDSGGASIGSSGHYPYGENWYESGTTTKLKFTTYERDSESSNDYAMARFHVNRFGRFSSPDPLAGSSFDPQSLNRYSYTMSDPVNLVDPLGFFNLPVLYCYGVEDGIRCSLAGFLFLPDPWQKDPHGGGGGRGGGGIGTALAKIKQIKALCDKVRSSGGGQIPFDGGVVSFDSSGGLIAGSVDLGHGMGFASAQLAGRDSVGRPSVIFSFSKPYNVGRATIDSVLFSGSEPPPMGLGQAGAFTAATGTVGPLGGSLAEFLILHNLNRSDQARGVANQIGSLFGSPCEGILADLALVGKF